MTPKRVEFAPGCFDDFDGTQQELDQLIAEIQRMALDGELEHHSVSLDLITEEQQEILELLVMTQPDRVLH